MTIRDMKGTVMDKIPVRNVIASVFYKDGLDSFVPGLLETCGDVRFVSTGGTYTELKKILGDKAELRLLEVAQITNVPEMEGGLVKTLHPKVHAGILGERNNLSHQQYINETIGGFYVDMVIGNLYPFQAVIEDIKAGKIDKKTGKPLNFESARGNIDIGGPTMLRGAAKNFMSCCAIVDPKDYDMILQELKANNGCTTFNTRFNMAKKVFATTASYDSAIAGFLAGKSAEEVKKIYEFSE